MKENVLKVLKELKELNHDQLETVADGIINLLVELERPAEPQIGDRCIFWNDENPIYANFYVVGFLAEKKEGTDAVKDLYRCVGASYFDNCRLLIKEAE
jgi:hypothetical protein